MGVDQGQREIRALSGELHGVSNGYCEEGIWMVWTYKEGNSVWWPQRKEVFPRTLVIR